MSNLVLRLYPAAYRAARVDTAALVVAQTVAAIAPGTAVASNPRSVNSAARLAARSS